MDRLDVAAWLAVTVAVLAVAGAAWRLVAGVLGEPAGLATVALVALAIVVAAAAGARSRRLATPYW